MQYTGNHIFMTTGAAGAIAHALRKSLRLPVTVYFLRKYSSLPLKSPGSAGILMPEDQAMIPEQVAMYHKYNDLVREGDYYRIAHYAQNHYYDCYEVAAGGSLYP